MTVRACLFVTAITVAVGRLCAADHGPDLLPTVGSIERLDPRLDALVPPGASIEVLAMGFAWTEGPVWVPDDRGGLPAGTHLGTLLTGEATANCAFDATGTTLYITADSLLCRVKLTDAAAN